MKKHKIAEGVAVTAELCGASPSDIAIEHIVNELAGLTEKVIESALRKVARGGRFSLAKVLDAIDDGRPGVEEAWAMMPSDEASTVVWTKEMAAAFYACAPLLEEGDKIAARMVFKEKYPVLVANARDAGLGVNWTATLGHDPENRESVLRDAVMRGKLSKDSALKSLPSLSYPVLEGGKRLLANLSAKPEVLVDDGMRAYDYLDEINQQLKVEEEEKRVRREKESRRAHRRLDLQIAFAVLNEQ